MEAQVNVSHQHQLLPQLVNIQTNRNTCNKPSTSFYRKYVVLKMTSAMRDLTNFLTCEVNIMLFFFIAIFKKIACFHLRIYLLRVWSKACKCLRCK